MTAIIFDTEMHKLNGDIIEAAFITVELKGNSIIAGWRECHQFKPSEAICFGAMAVHHILDSDLEFCPPYTRFKLPVFEKPIEYIIGHNVDCDTAAIDRAGASRENIKSICTLAMARYLWPDLTTHNLSALAYRFAKDKPVMRTHLKNAHNALADCITTITLLEAIIAEKNITSMQELFEFSEMARIPTTMSFGKHKGERILDLPQSYKNWLLGLPDLDPYLRQAMEASNVSNP